MSSPADRYTHGHHESVLRSHTWRTAENSAKFLLPHLRSGDTLLDVGCGPGTISADLARVVSPDTVVGVDQSAEVIALARANIEGHDYSNLSFGVGDVYALEFADSSFNVAYAHQVLQHLSDPVRALKEVRRVLRAGGLLAVRDADYGAFAWAPGDQRLDRWLELYHEITRANDAEADAGRYLARWVADAGFTVWTESSSEWTFETNEERMWWGELWADRVLHSDFAHHGLEYGLTTPDELSDISDAFNEWSLNEDGTFVVAHNEVLARNGMPIRSGA
jgi:ubiquinone/menaquinone biosynthesis C-methylase UbiE